MNLGKIGLLMLAVSIGAFSCKKQKIKRELKGDWKIESLVYKVEYGDGNIAKHTADTGVFKFYNKSVNIIVEDTEMDKNDHYWGVYKAFDSSYQMNQLYRTKIEVDKEEKNITIDGQKFDIEYLSDNKLSCIASDTNEFSFFSFELSK